MPISSGRVSGYPGQEAECSMQVTYSATPSLLQYEDR